MLILITGASYMLVKKFNANAEVVKREQETHAALMQAKAALIAYAVNYPEMNEKPDRGPGYLPCPDQGANPMPDPLPSTYDESLIDGKKEGNCASSSGTTLGLLPYGDLGLTDIRDSSGERLWYGVSQNYKTHQDITYVLNSETPGSIQVDGQDDIVAVIIAPGPPLDFQNGRRGAAEYEALVSGTTPSVYIVANEYLESENAIYGGGDELYTYGEALDAEDFNDHVVAITRQELMQAVERRVTNQARKALAEYYRENASYPWLVAHSDPLAAPDPKADARWIKGTAGSNSTETQLCDTTTDFSQLGIRDGDTVWNLTDGSWASVLDVVEDEECFVSRTTARVVLAGVGLAFGSNNELDVGDEYYIDASGMSEALSGTATAGSADNELRDSDKDFSKLGIAPGDILDRLGPSGEILSASQIVRVESDRLVAHSTTLAIEVGDNYKIRSNGHIADAGSSGLTLEDNSVDFHEMGIEAGNTIRNLSDRSVGRITSVDSANNQFTVFGLYNGDDNQFENGDSYSVSRFRPRENITRGFLPVHQPGETIMPENASIDWSLTEANGNNVVTDYLAATEGFSTVSPTYLSALEQWIQTSEGYSDTVTVITTEDSNDAACIWVNSDIMNCSLYYRSRIDGDIDSSTATSMTDTSRNFPRLGAKRGDKIVNSNDASSGIVTSTSGTSQLNISNISGQANLNKNAGQPYQLEIASRYTDGLATAPTQQSQPVLHDSSGNLSAASIGDVIENTTLNSIGIVTDVDPDGMFVEFSWLQGGTRTDFAPGQEYRIHHGYVTQREYLFDFRLPAALVSEVTSAEREIRFCNRDDSSSDCPAGLSMPSEKIIIGDGTTALVTITDYDESSAAIAEAVVTAPDTEIGSEGSVRVAGMVTDFKFIPGLDMPEWFLNNRWNQYIYAGYSEGFAPDSPTPACGGGGEPPCLTVNTTHPDGSMSSDSDNQAIVIGTGSQSGIQDRAVPRLQNYMEGENALSDNLLYEKRFLSAEFNDQIRVVCPDPFYPEPANPICAP
ncbi:MAG: hypothetical protein WD572_11330 [Gammaproteobacteria bacterium]